MGGLVNGLTLNDILFGVSQCRNEKLAAVFYRLKLIEAYVTGIQKIMDSFRKMLLSLRLSYRIMPLRLFCPIEI
ncbi:ATP-binding protein [Sporomusa silvacetica]|uniref:ATP-binding protein n=1 Tax=Sporomusa silvacetica TaxID=55504 RepID=UPI00146AD386